MGGVDLLGSFLGRGKITMRSKKWYMRMIYHIFDTAVVHIWILYKKKFPERNTSLVRFRKELAYSLLKRETKSSRGWLTTPVTSTRRAISISRDIFNGIKLVIFLNMPIKEGDVKKKTARATRLLNAWNVNVFYVSQKIRIAFETFILNSDELTFSMVLLFYLFFHCDFFVIFFPEFLTENLWILYQIFVSCYTFFIMFNFVFYFLKK